MNSSATLIRCGRGSDSIPAAVATSYDFCNSILPGPDMGAWSCPGDLIWAESNFSLTIGPWILALLGTAPCKCHRPAAISVQRGGHPMDVGPNCRGEPK